jgi:hypothetical protein
MIIVLALRAGEQNSAYNPLPLFFHPKDVPPLQGLNKNDSLGVFTVKKNFPSNT